MLSVGFCGIHGHTLLDSNLKTNHSKSLFTTWDIWILLLGFLPCFRENCSIFEDTWCIKEPSNQQCICLWVCQLNSQEILEWWTLTLKYWGPWFPILQQGYISVHGVPERPNMNRYSSGIHVQFHSSYEPTTAHKYQEYHMDLKDHLAVTFDFMGKIFNIGYQANMLATQESRNGFYHEGQYSQGIFQAKG